MVVSTNSTNTRSERQAGVHLRQRLQEREWRYDDGLDGPPHEGQVLSESSSGASPHSPTTMSRSISDRTPRRGPDRRPVTSAHHAIQTARRPSKQRSAPGRPPSGTATARHVARSSAWTATRRPSARSHRSSPRTPTAAKALTPDQPQAPSASVAPQPAHARPYDAHTRDRPRRRARKRAPRKPRDRPN
jgi:hypothetical protein